MIIEITKDRLNEIKSSKKNKLGSFGGISPLDGKLFKYYCSIEKDFLNRIEPQLWNLANHQVDGVALPIDIVYCEDELVGYTQPFFEGIIIEDFLKNIKSTDCISVEKYLDSILDKFYLLAQKGISSYDVCARNMIYSDGEIKLFDCDLYYFDNSKSEEDLYKESVKNFLYSVDEDCDTIPSFTQSTKERIITYINAHSYDAVKKRREAKK